MTRLGIFAVAEPPTPRDLELVAAVVYGYRFPWAAVLPDTVRDTGAPIVRVGFIDEAGSWGFYARRTNGVNVDPSSTYGETNLRQVLAHELGHLIDDAVLSVEARTEIHHLFHDGSPTSYDACPIVEHYTHDLWRWQGHGVAHHHRPSEAFAWLAPHLWAPDHAKPMPGYGPHTFARAADIGAIVMAETRPPFPDVPDDSPHASAIAELAGAGIIDGRPDGTFGGGDPVTRAQVASIIVRAVEEYDRGWRPSPS